MEKKLNRADLRNYKNKKQPQIQSMIPGLNNIPSIGTNPLKRGAIRVMQFADDAGVRADRHKGQIFFSPEPRGPQHTFRKSVPKHPLTLSPRQNNRAAS
jgi:hypothetical protein